MPDPSGTRGDEDEGGYVPERIRPQPRCRDRSTEPDADRIVDDAVKSDLYRDWSSAGEHEYAGRLPVGGTRRPVQSVSIEIVLADEIADDHIAAQVLVFPWREGVGVHGHAGQSVADDAIALDHIVIRGGTGAGIGEQYPGTLALYSVSSHHIVPDDVAVDARDRWLRNAGGVKRVAVVPGDGDPAVIGVSGDDVVLDQVVMRGPDVVAQQHAAGIVGDVIVEDSRVGDASREMNALAAVAGNRSRGRAFEVLGLGRHAAAEVVVLHCVPGDHDAGYGTAEARGENSLTLGVPHGEPGEIDLGTHHDHGGEDGLRP